MLNTTDKWLTTDSKSSKAVSTFHFSGGQGRWLKDMRGKFIRDENRRLKQTFASFSSQLCLSDIY